MRRYGKARGKDGKDGKDGRTEGRLISDENAHWREVSGE